MKLSDSKIKKLNSTKALYQFFSKKDPTIEKILDSIEYENELKKLQEELMKLQYYIIDNKLKIVIIFEGRDAAGKGGAIRRITEHLNPRNFKVVALSNPSELEIGQWYFQRYFQQLPNEGEIVFFDRSWYNRAVVEPVNGFCTLKQYDTYMSQVNDVERMLVESGNQIIKLYFSISKNEQKKRFNEIKRNPLKKWKYSEVDKKALKLWDDYTHYKEKMFEKTNTKYANWKIIEADKKNTARLNTIKYLLETIPYKIKG